MVIVDIDRLASEIVNEVKVYTEAVKKEIKKKERKLAKEAVQDLHNKSPKRYGEYAKGWKSKTPQIGNTIIYNETKPHITHLLEYGHLSRDGVTHVRPIEHIETVTTWLTTKYIREVERIIVQQGRRS